MKIGFIGLGVMGRPMAGHLIDAGHTLTLNRVKAVSQELVDRGGGAVETPGAVANATDVVILMVPDTPDVEAVLFGEGGVGSGLTPGKLVIDMSSISPVATKAFAARIEAMGCDYLDAPVSGGEVGARNAELTIMVGGRPEALERARPVLEAMSKPITHINPSGDGQTAKVANQIIVGLTIQAVAEALTFVERAGADLERVRDALLGGLAGSTILKIHGERMIKRTFDPIEAGSAQPSRARKPSRSLDHHHDSALDPAPNNAPSLRRRFHPYFRVVESGRTSSAQRRLRDN